MVTHRAPHPIKRIVTIAIIIVIVAAGSLIAAGFLRGPSTQPRPPAMLAAPDASGFTRVEGPMPLTFPADHAAHPEYQTEWWYYTGNLADSGGRRFGYQLTFFRRALDPTAPEQPRASDWAADQAYMAHFAMTDAARQEYRSFEKLSRGAAGLAGAQPAPFRVWLEDWGIDTVAEDTYRLYAGADDHALDLTLKDIKGPILQGDSGYSQKGPEPGNASTYYSLTHLETTGTIRAGGETITVSGLSWMDHEFSTSALAPDQIGWDWFAIQLDNDFELMLFHMRKSDGSIDKFSSGTLVAPDGKATHLDVSQFAISTSGTWQSPRSGATYPAGWHIEIPSADIILDLEPLVADQELNVSSMYWEGAVRISGLQDKKPVTGYGYVELTGYTGSMAGQF